MWLTTATWSRRSSSKRHGECDFAPPPLPAAGGVASKHPDRADRVRACRQTFSVLASLTDEQVVDLLPRLEDAARADPKTTPTRFVPPRTGILEQTAAKRHLFIFGRRGVGKSTLLRTIEQDSERFGARVLFIDVETLRGRPYPDVLIELLIELLKELDAGLSAAATNPIKFVSTVRTRRKVRALRRTLGHLLSEPQEAKHTVRELQKQNRGASGGFHLPQIKGLSARAEVSRASSQESEAEAEFVRTKMEGLLAAAVQIRGVLSAASDQMAGTPTLVVLDDYYHVRYDDQPLVLAYLHQVVKNLSIYLKICGVRHRIKPFVEGDPPTGLQLGHDAGDLSLDITLEQFSAAQTFLEEVLNGVAAPTGIAVDDLATETARERLVLGSGGVARDYLDLVSKAVRKANERTARPDRPHNRITAEDVNEAAADLSVRKQDDLKLDAGPEADELRSRLSDVVEFCLGHNRTNVFLVEGTDLHETDWGREIETLTDLRLMHQLGNFSLPSGGWRGRRFVGFTLDLSHWTGTRSERIKQIEFWKPGLRRELRRTALVYTPGAARQPREPDAGTAAGSVPRGVDWEQPPLPFEEGEPVDHEAAVAEES
jgi:hypothetical protein